MSYGESPLRTYSRRSTRSQGQTSRAPPSPPRQRLFWSPIQDDAGNITNYEETYRKLLTKKHVPGRWIEYDKFVYREFQQRLQHMEWDEFLTMTIRGHFYPKLVSMFYANLKPVDEHTLMTLVKGETLFISQDLLHEILLIPNHGLDIVNIRVDQLEDPMDYSSIFSSRITVFSKDLVDEARMIHKVICANIVTKKGNFDRITEDALKVLYCFMRGIRINLASYILDRMSEAMNLPSLPYGLIITRILMHYQVDFTGEDFEEVGPPFNARSLSLMKIRAPEIEEEAQAEEEAGPSTAPGASPDIVLEELRKTRTQMAKLRKSQKKLHKRQGILTRTVKGFGKMLKTIYKNQQDIMRHLGCGAEASISSLQPRRRSLTPPYIPPSPGSEHVQSEGSEHTLRVESEGSDQDRVEESEYESD